MPMTRVADTLRTPINHHLLRAGRSGAEKINTAGFEGVRLRHHLRGPRWQSDHRCVAEHPDSLFSQSVASTVLIVIIRKRTDEQGVGHVLETITTRVKKPATVVVAKSGNAAALRKSSKKRKHFLQHSIEFLGNRNVV